MYNFEDCYDELLECGIIICWEDLLCYGVMGWDVGCFNFMVCVCYDMKYIFEDEVWYYINYVYEMVYSYFFLWYDFVMSYVIGCVLWGGKSVFNLGMMYMVEDLLKSEKSLWIKIEW